MIHAMLSHEARAKLPGGDTFATKLTRVSQLVAAEHLLGQLDSIELGAEGASVIQLPQFAVTMFEGRRTVNRIQWDGNSSVRVVPLGSRVEIGWKVEDSTLPTEAGRVVVTEIGVVDGELPQLVDGTEPVSSMVFSRVSLGRKLEMIAQAGRGEMVVLVKKLGPYTAYAVESAARRVYREIHDLQAMTVPVIDRLEMETVTDLVLYGDRGTASSVVTRLVRRVAATDAVRKKSLLQVISWAIWSAAETNVRSYIGDPHAGRAIRRTAKLIKSRDPEKVLSAFRDSHPGTDVGINRVVSALSAGATVATQQVELEHVGGES